MLFFNKKIKNQTLKISLTQAILLKNYLNNSIKEWSNTIISNNLPTSKRKNLDTDVITLNKLREVASLELIKLHELIIKYNLKLDKDKKSITQYIKELSEVQRKKEFYTSLLYSANKNTPLKEVDLSKNLIVIENRITVINQILSKFNDGNIVTIDNIPELSNIYKSLNIISCK